MIRVGTNQLLYNEVRNFAGLPFQNVCFRKVLDLYKVPAYLQYKLFNKVNYKLIFRFNDLGLHRKIDLFHFFNGITPVKKPWVVTFETKVPRPDVNFLQGYAWLAGKYCKKIIAYSERAYNAELQLLKQHPCYCDDMLPKMTVLRPSQPLIANGLEHKDYSGFIHFLFAGHAFYRKGGYELVKAFAQCYHKGLPVRLTMVSKLEVEGYCDRNISPDIEAETHRLIAGNPSVTWYRQLSNKQVLQLLLEAHVGILPSFGETYGYFLLEAMACGCAVVATAVSPLTEIVSDQCGYLLNVPTAMKDVEYIDIDNPARYKEISARLTERIFQSIEAICNDTKLLQAKSLLALQHIREKYSPFDRAAALEKIYHEALVA